MIKSKTYPPTTCGSGMPESLHLSGLLTRYDPESSIGELSDRRSGRLRVQATATSVTAHRRTTVRPSALVAPDPLAELGILSAEISRGGIGSSRLPAHGKRVPMGVISVLVVVIATLVVGFACRRPLGHLLVSGPAPLAYKTDTPRGIAAPAPRRKPTSGLADSQQRGRQAPVSAAPTRALSLPKGRRGHRVVTHLPAKTADNISGGSETFSSDPPGALFTHIGTAQ